MCQAARPTEAEHSESTQGPAHNGRRQQPSPPLPLLLSATAAAPLRAQAMRAAAAAAAAPPLVRLVRVLAACAALQCLCARCASAEEPLAALAGSRGGILEAALRARGREQAARRRAAREGDRAQSAALPPPHSSWAREAHAAARAARC